MGILNNIWNALSTENEILISIIMIPIAVIEDYLSLLLFSNILKLEYTKSQRNTYVFTISLISIISMNIIPSPLNTIINYLLIFLIIKKLFNLPIIKNILAVVLPFFTFAIIGTFVLNILVKILDAPVFYFTNIPLYRIIYLIIIYLLILILIYLLKLKSSRIKIENNFNKHNKNIVITNLLLGIFTLIIQLIITTFYTNVLPIYITILSSISLILYMIINFYSLNHILKLQTATTKLENAESYNKTLSFLYDNIKGFKHDFDDIVNMIGGYVRNNDLNGLKKYYVELENDYKKVKNIATLNPNLINNPGIYNLIVNKYKKAIEFGVKINLEYFFDFEKLHMPIYQFSRMLGILLDNAIEAASTSNEKQVEIRFRDSQRNNTQIIIIQNTYTNKDVDTKKIFEKGFSEKQEHMGMGLWEVNQIIKQNNNINLITNNDDKYFKQQLEIYY